MKERIKHSLIIVLFMLVFFILYGLSSIWEIENEGYVVSLLDPSYVKVTDNASIYLTASEDNYSYKSKSIEVSLTNDTDKWLLYGLTFKLEVFIDGKWYKVPSKQGSLFPLIGIELQPRSAAVLDIPIELYQCKRGTFRIIKDMSVKEVRDYKKENLDWKTEVQEIDIAAEFNLI